MALTTICPYKQAHVNNNHQYNGARIQLLDLPGIVEGASGGKGRGRQVIATARTSDLILVMLDSSKADIQKSVCGFIA